MPLKYEIFPGLGIVYVKYWGVATVPETAAVFGQFTQDPNFRPDLKHLVDLEDIVEYERSFPELMKLQAMKASALMPASSPSYLIYYAPNPVSLTMARSVLKSWDGLSAVVGRVVQTEEEALHLLGLEQRSFADLPMNSA